MLEMSFRKHFSIFLFLSIALSSLHFCNWEIASHLSWIKHEVRWSASPLRIILIRLNKFTLPQTVSVIVILPSRSSRAALAALLIIPSLFYDAESAAVHRRSLGREGGQCRSGRTGRTTRRLLVCSIFKPGRRYQPRFAGVVDVKQVQDTVTLVQTKLTRSHQSRQVRRVDTDRLNLAKSLVFAAEV